jgi:hypothetical protein
MGVADDEGDAREGRDFFWGALGITAGYEDACGGIGSVDFAYGIASLGVSGSGDGACVKNDDVGCGRIGRKNAALFAELPLNGRAIGLSGAASELLDKECAHGSEAPESYLSIWPHGNTARPDRHRFTTSFATYTI